MPRSNDLILLRPPSVYYFRTRTIPWGPIADVLPSLLIFEMYLLGSSSIYEVLTRNKIKSKIINLAYLKVADLVFNLENRIRTLKAKEFGIDLFRLCYVYWSIKISRISKNKI